MTGAAEIVVDAAAAVGCCTVTKPAGRVESALLLAAKAAKLAAGLGFARFRTGANPRAAETTARSKRRHERQSVN